jgi:HK97 family phage major capsid protein
MGTQSANLYAKWLRGGDNALSAEDWGNLRAQMSTTVPEEGGFTIQTEIAKSVVDALKAYGGVRNVATVLPTATGAPMSWPTSDGTSEEGEILEENEEAGDGDVKFGTLSLDTFKFSSKVVTVPIELLQDSAVNLEQYVNGRLVQRIGRITNKKFTIGTGTKEPRGLLTAAKEGKVAPDGQEGVTPDDLVDLEHAVDPAYRDNAKWMFHDSVLRELKKMKDTTGRPLWVPGVAVKAPDMIGGYPYQINQHMPPLAAGAKCILFGDFSHYFVRDALAMQMFRFTDSAYARRGQVGFLMFSRNGGNLVDVGGAVKYFQCGKAAAPEGSKSTK